MRRLVAACCLLAGCDRVFGVQFTGPDAASGADLDEDGIPDVVDDCLQAPEDLAGDDDGAAPLNGEDACPLDWAHGEDEDSDALPVQCDPLPDAGFDGERRCFMSFSSGTLNGRLWYSRDGAGWSAGTGELLFDSDSDLTLSMLPATELRVAATTTVDALFEVTRGGTLTELTLWVAANDPPLIPPGSPTDSACVVEANSGNWAVRVRGTGPRNTVVMTPFVVPSQIRIRATYVPGNLQSTLRCDARVIDVTDWVRTDVALTFPPTGRIGFGGRSGTIRVKALDILEHP